MSRFTASDKARAVLEKAKGRAKEIIAAKRNARGSQQSEGKSDGPGRRLARGHLERAKGVAKAENKAREANRPGDGPPDHAPAHGYRRRMAQQGTQEGTQSRRDGPPDHAPAHGYRSRFGNTSVETTPGNSVTPGTPSGPPTGNETPNPTSPTNAPSAAAVPPEAAQPTGNASAKGINAAHAGAGGYRHHAPGMTTSKQLGGTPGYAQRAIQGYASRWRQG